MGCTLRETSSRRVSAYRWTSRCATALDDSNLSDLKLTDEDDFGQEAVDALGKIAQDVAHMPAPVSFSFGENSD